MDIENLAKQLNKNDEWIQNADMKLSVILAFLGVLGGILLTQGKVFELAEDGFSKVVLLLILFYIISFIFLIASFVSAIKGLTATLKNSHESLWFFGDVAKFDNWVAFKRMKKVQTPETELDDLLSQIHTTACIARSKFKRLNSSIKYGTWSVFSLAIYLILKSWSVYL